MPPPPGPATKVIGRAWTMEIGVQNEPSICDKMPIPQDRIERLEKDKPIPSTSASNPALQRTTPTAEGGKEGIIGKTSIESTSPCTGFAVAHNEPFNAETGTIVIDLTQDSTPKEASSDTTVEDLHTEDWKKRGLRKANGGMTSDSCQHISVATPRSCEVPDDMPPPPAGYRYSKSQRGLWSLKKLHSSKIEVAQPIRVPTGANSEVLADGTRPEARASVTRVDLPVIPAIDEPLPTTKVKRGMERSGGRKVRILWPHVRKFFEEQEAEWSARKAQRDEEHQE